MNPSSLVSKVLALKAAFADRKDLDNSIAAIDKADWDDWVRPTMTSGPAQSSQAVRSSSSGRSRGRVRGQPINSADLSTKPMKPTCPNSVPKQINNALTWDVVKLRTPVTLTSGLVEANVAVSLATHPQSASWMALFDQWCIPQFSVTWYLTVPLGSVTNLPELHTALDFDNISNFGNLQSIDDFDNCVVEVMVPNKRYTRSIKPCTKITGPTSAGALLGRNWCDSSASATAWNGIRAGYNSLSPLSSGNVFYETTIWYCFRNRI
jgi:hypothetical protein